MFEKHARFSLSLLSVFLLALVMAPSAEAGTSAPGWAMLGNVTPTDLPPGGIGVIELNLNNLGAKAQSAGAVISDTLPADLTTTGHTAIIVGNGGEQAGECGLVTAHEVQCRLPFVAPRQEEVDQINIDVKVSPDAEGSAIDRATVVGGGALRPTSIAFPVTFGSTEPPAGFAHIDEWITNTDGSTDTQAGSHPYDFAFAFELNKVPSSGIINPSTYGFKAKVRLGASCVT